MWSDGQNPPSRMNLKGCEVEKQPQGLMSHYYDGGEAKEQSNVIGAMDA